MARKRSDVLERAIEDALVPGSFIGYRESGAFVEGVEVVRSKIELLLKMGEAGRAVAFLETFIAACYEKADEIDDSGGSFGQFVGELFCDWIRARQAAKEDPEETVRMLLSWMDKDDYGYCHGLEKEAVRVLNQAGLDALDRAVREAAGSTECGSYLHHRKADVLRAIHEARRDVEAYAALCESEGGVAPADCEVLAEMCLKRHGSQDALTWVERGLEQQEKSRWQGRPAWRLADLKREILKKLGRSADALASAWDDYRKAPSVHSYEDLMKFVPRSERPEWHAKALTALDGAGLASRIDLLVKTREWERLAETVRSASRGKLAQLSHYTIEPAAKRLAKPYPLLAAKLHAAMALRILEAKKSKYYDAALVNLEKARQLLLRAGRNGEWEALVLRIKEDHRLKSGFMPGFLRLVEGRSTREPSFLERARKRWHQRVPTGRTRP